MAELKNTALSPFTRGVLLLAAGLGITVATGVVCGRVSQRWGPVPDAILAADHLKSLPEDIGTWHLAEEQQIPGAIIDTLQCAGYVNRKYVDRHTGSAVHLAVIVGPSGPISVHTPEICFSSQAYSIEDPRRAKELVDSAGSQHSFWYTTFKSTNAIAEHLRVYYGWSSDGNWRAVESPRFEFAGKPLLFKLQISSYISPENSSSDKDPCQAFLERLLESGWKVDG